MSLPKRYNPSTREPQLQEQWQAQGTYHFEQGDEQRPVYSIDTPPPTVSGLLHLGHVYSYSQTDFIARFWRMNGANVFYPMGYDDNGLPTERLVERREGVRATDIGRQAFIERCLEVSEEAEKEYEALWQRLGLSVDWRYSYRTIDENSRRLSQWSFLDLYRKGLAYLKKAPTIWCPECGTAIAQAEVNDLSRETVFHTLAFPLADGQTVPIATTRPELLPACVAVFIHPDDPRAPELVGQTVTVPLFGQRVPLLADPGADPTKGTGIVMCCTFGDTADVEWWHTHDLPLLEAIGRDGKMLETAGPFAGLPTAEARQQIVAALAENRLLLAQQPTAQTVRVHERCDTPVEYMVNRQWFVRVLDNIEAFIQAGTKVNWHPAHMETRYRQWVENLGWDWCISRQRYFGVPFPLWHCAECGEVVLAEEAQLPVDPTTEGPPHPCSACGSSHLEPETDVMDTWATSSMSPQIVGQMLANPSLYARVFPFSLRPQAHEIIRTWAFDTIVKSHYHFNTLPWSDVAISGWGLAPEGMGKISKSRGGGPVAPLAMIEQYSADAVRYWAASTALGKDSVIDEQKIQAGAKLVNKLWNVARFSARFLEEVRPSAELPEPLTLADRWLLSRTQRLIERVTALYRSCDYATAKAETELFFWQMADNYLEMAKKRLYDGGPEARGAQAALSQALLVCLQLLAPILPYVTEAIYQGLLATEQSIHHSRWPQADERLLDEAAEAAGETLVEIATAVRRYKSEHGLGLGAELDRLHLTTADQALAALLEMGEADLLSITRAQQVTIGAVTPAEMKPVDSGDTIVGVALIR